MSETQLRPNSINLVYTENNLKILQFFRIMEGKLFIVKEGKLILPNNVISSYLF